MAEIIIGDYKYYLYESGNTWVRAADKTKSSYDDIPNTITYEGQTYTVTSMEQCFYGCSSLVTAPAIPSTVTEMDSCFYGCSSLTAAPIIPAGTTTMEFCFSGCSSLATAPVIPNGVTNMYACFQRCRSLVTAPTIPASVTNMSYCFGRCTSLTGNIFVKNNPTVYEYIFTSDVVNPIFIKPDTGITLEGIAKWRTIADLYSNVTLISPSITFQTFSAYRVEHQNDITQYEEGTYALLQIQYTSDLPTGGSIIKNVTANGSVITPVWTESTNDGITVGRAWVSQATSSQVTYMISLSDSDGVTESETKSFTVVKVEALIDFLDGSQGMGIAFGTIATQTGFECAMDAVFNGDAQFADNDNTLRLLFDFIHPVGSFYETSDSTFDPNVTWGGTWVVKSSFDNGIVLFDNDVQPVSGAVTLSDSAANYDRIDICYRSNDNFYDSTSVYTPNNKNAILWTAGVTATTNNHGRVYAKIKVVNITGTTINTRYNNVSGTYYYYTAEKDMAVTGVGTVGDYIAITQVIGYKKVNRWHRTA